MVARVELGEQRGLDGGEAGPVGLVAVAGGLGGALVTAPLVLLGPRTGTNNTVSSGAHFGVSGRIVGSVLTLLFALAYAAIAVWTSGDALVAAAHPLLGTPAGDGALAVGYALTSIEIALVALYGHATVVQAATARRFHPPGSRSPASRTPRTPPSSRAPTPPSSARRWTS